MKIQADLHEPGQPLIGSRLFDGRFECRLIFNLPDKVESMLDGHKPSVSQKERLINHQRTCAMIYDLFAYGKMITDTARMEAYAGALRERIDPDKVVLDIGTGTGILALLACRYGAKQVVAVEPGNVIDLAKEICAANGWSANIRFYQQRSFDISLPEPVDLIVSDLRGVLPLFQQHIPSIIDARDRLLSPSGMLIPMRDRLHMSVVSAGDLIAEYRHPWIDSPYGIEMQPVADCLFHRWRKAVFQQRDLLSSPALWTTIDYRTIQQTDVQGTVEMKITKSGAAHGFAVWFDTDLLADVGFSSAPGKVATVYGQAFFPWPEEVALAAGDTVVVSLKAVYAGNDYIWWWDSKINPSNGTSRSKVEFRQSTFFSNPLGLQNLHKRDRSFAPRLGASGRIDRFILHQMDGNQSLSDIARRTRQQFPDRFSTVEHALRRVADLSEKYGHRGPETT